MKQTYSEKKNPEVLPIGVQPTIFCQVLRRLQSLSYGRLVVGSYTNFTQRNQTSSNICDELSLSDGVVGIS